MTDSTIKKDYVLTVFTGLLLGLGIILLNAVIARWKGLEFLGEYLFLRRLGYSSIGLLLMGMNIALPYYTPKTEGRHYIQYAILVFAVFTLPLILVLLYIARAATISGFTTHNYVFYCLWFIAVSLQYLSYSYLRGLLKISQANSIQLLLSIILHILFLLVTDDIYHYIIYLSLAIIVVSIITIITTLWRNYPPYGFSFKNIRIFLRYGYNRVPSQFAQLIIMNLFPLLLITAVGYHDLAFYNSSFSILRLFWFIIGPIGIVLLPHLAKKFDSKEISNIKTGLDRMLLTLNTLSFSALILIVIWAVPIMSVWLDTAIPIAGNTLAIMVIALPFYAFNGAVRGIIDASAEHAWNSLIYVTAVIIMVLVWGVGNYLTENLIALAAIGFVMSQVSAFGMNLYIIRTKLGIAISVIVDYYFIFYVTLISFTSIMIMKYFSIAYIHGLLLLSFIITIYILFCLKYYPKPWFRQLISDIVKRGKTSEN